MTKSRAGFATDHMWGHNQKVLRLLTPGNGRVFLYVRLAEKQITVCEECLAFVKAVILVYHNDCEVIEKDLSYWGQWRRFAIDQWEG